MTLDYEISLNASPNFSVSFSYYPAEPTVAINP